MNAIVSIDEECIKPNTTMHQLPAREDGWYIYLWEFEEDGRPLRVRVDGPLVFNDTDLMRASAIASLGIAYLYADDAEEDIAAGRLIRILEDWCPLLPGYYLYHPSRRQTPPALVALIAALRDGHVVR